MMIPSRRKLGAAALIIAGIGAFMVPFLLHSPTTQGTSGNNNSNGTRPKDYTSSSIACSPNTIATGSKSTCTARVPDTTTATNTPTGTVSFSSSNPGVGTVAASCTLSAGSCTADFSGVATGTATVTGAYGGDSSHNGSSGSTSVIIATTTGDSGGNGGGNNGSGGSGGMCSEDKAKDPSPSDNGEGQHKGNAWGVLKNQMDTTVAAVKAMGVHNSAFHLHHDTKTDNDTVKVHNASSESSNDHDSSCAEKEETNDD